MLETAAALEQDDCLPASQSKSAQDIAVAGFPAAVVINRTDVSEAQLPRNGHQVG